MTIVVIGSLRVNVLEKPPPYNSLFYAFPSGCYREVQHCFSYSTCFGISLEASSRNSDQMLKMPKKTTFDVLGKSDS